MRIGIISTYPPIECGIATYTQYLSDALRQQQNDVYIVSHLGGSGPQVFPAFDYEDGDLADKAFRVMVRLTPDVVHIQHEFGLFGKHFGIAVIPLIMQFRMAGIPVVTTLHTVYREISREHRVIIESICANSDRVIVHEPYQVQTLANNLAAAMADKVVRIPHGARLVEPVPNAKKRLGLPEDRKIILIIGYFRPSKNFELVVDIFPQIVRRCPEAVLVVAGKTRGTEHKAYRNYLFDKIARSEFKDQIYIIRGQLPQDIFDTIISASDVVILPYNISSQSGILAHCFSFGKPVVTSTTEAMRQTLSETGTGITCDSHADYVDAVVKLLHDRQLAGDLSKNAREYVRKQISWPLVARQHLELYSAVMDIPRIESNIILVD